MSDLQKFTLLFGLEFKQLKGKVEYRGVADLDNTVVKARQLIAEKGFELEARTVGDSASMRSFFVLEG